MARGETKIEVPCTLHRRDGGGRGTFVVEKDPEQRGKFMWTARNAAGEDVNGGANAYVATDANVREYLLGDAIAMGYRPDITVKQLVKRMRALAKVRVRRAPAGPTADELRARIDELTAQLNKLTRR